MASDTLNKFKIPILPKIQSGAVTNTSESGLVGIKRITDPIGLDPINNELNTSNKVEYKENNTLAGTKSKQYNLGKENLPGKIVFTDTDDVKDNNYNLNFTFPRYSVLDYINERSSWQKQLGSITGEPGWFYFKIFFKFDTNYGLLGGIMNDNKNSVLSSTNTAINYLYNIKDYYIGEKISDRMLALYKFVGTLSFISSEAPWFFKGISGLNNIKAAYTSDFHKDKIINIICSEDAVDMRLGTLLDLYKYACFDNIGCKEIIPANLRKFDMNIVLFHIPIKFHQTPIIDKEKGIAYDGKSFNVSPEGGVKLSNTVSFKLFTFQNCEIITDNLNDYLGESLSNETPFTTGKNSISIAYDRVFEHRMNEWNQFMFGSDGFYYNVNSPNKGLDNNFIINKPDDNKFEDRELLIQVNKDTLYSSLVNYSEYLIRDSLSHIQDLNEVSSTGNIYGSYTKVLGSYYQNKLKYFKAGTVEGGSIYNYDFGRTGEGLRRVNTEYLNKKLSELKDGTTKGKNLYDFNYGIVHKGKETLVSPYFIEKLARIKNGSIGLGPIPDNLATPNTFDETRYNHLSAPESLAKPNTFKLNGNAQASKNSYNPYNVEGVYDENKSFFSNLVNNIWNTTKSNFGFGL